MELPMVLVAASRAAFQYHRVVTPSSKREAGNVMKRDTQKGRRTLQQIEREDKETHRIRFVGFWSTQ